MSGSWPSPSRRSAALAGVLPELGGACAPAPLAADDRSSRLDSYVAARLQEPPDPARLERLEELAAHVAGAEPPRLVFLCTHNSRRSHLAQVWAGTGAARFGLDDVETFSGGTEATAFDPRAVAALGRAGFDVERGEPVGFAVGTPNPRYTLRAGDGPVFECFSKVHDDPANPARGFAAVLVCSDADRACPDVPGADARIALPYVDPKVSDGTPEEAATYDERCAEIAREMLWVMRRAAERRG